jgi:signal transduction histidine kinase
MRRLLTPLVRARTWSETAHLLLDLPLGIAWFTVVVTGVSLGAGLVVVALTGVLVLAATIAFGRAIGVVERARARALLGLTVTPPARRLDPVEGSWRRLRGTLRDATGWKALVYGIVMLPLGIANFTVAVTLWSIGLAGVAFPTWAWAIRLDDWHGHAIHGWAKAGYISTTFVVGAFVLIVTPMLVHALANLDRLVVKGLLAGSPTAELRQRVETLTVSRDASVDVAQSERRRIERDLHDGVQPQLVNLAIDLGLAHQKLTSDTDADPALVAIVGRAHADSKRAISDLRDLVRGIHPAVLTDRGLDAAVSALVARSPMPVEVDITLPTRPPAIVESAAYFVIAEALTNAAKHSGASRVRIDVRQVHDRIRVEISDDGRGGATVQAGGGLAGLESRVGAIEGWLHVVSRPGGTTVLVELPSDPRATDAPPQS